MRKLLLGSCLLLAMIGGLIAAHEHASAQAVTQTPLPRSGPAGTESGPLTPNSLTSFLISNPYCYQPNPSVNQCSVNFRYIQATDNQTSAPFMTWLAIKISGKTRFNATAFFEGTIYYSYDMVPDGITVPCGTPNAGGAGSQFGYVYGVQVSPLDSNHNAMSTDIANVTCPAFSP